MQRLVKGILTFRWSSRRWPLEPKSPEGRQTQGRHRRTGAGIKIKGPDGKVMTWPN